MDEDLIHMRREELIEEVKRLRAGIRQHRDSTRHDSVGIILCSGACCRKRPIQYRWSRNGRNSSEDAWLIASRWTSRRDLLQGQMSRTRCVH